MIRALRLALLVAAGGGSAGCVPGATTRGAVAPPTTVASWRTLEAEHRVALDVRLDDGRHDRRTLRGFVAIERPDRFRLRALGPGGITLFDVLVRGSEVKVIDAVRDASKGALAEVVRDMAGDLSAGYDLAPAPAGRTAVVEGATVVVREPGHTVRLSGFRRLPGGVTFTHLAVERARYTVSVEVVDVTLDRALDPQLFAD